MGLRALLIPLRLGHIMVVVSIIWVIPLLKSLEVSQSTTSVVDDLVRVHEEVVHALVHFEGCHVLVIGPLFAQAVTLLDVGNEELWINCVDDLHIVTVRK